MQVGCAVVGQQLLSLSLSGDLNYLDRASDRPTKVSERRPADRAAARPDLLLHESARRR